MRDVAFYFRKKTGFPKITDSGLADVVLGGQGLTAVIHLVSADKDKRCVLFSLVFSPSLFYSSLPSFHPCIINIVNALASRIALYSSTSFPHKTPRALYEAISPVLVRLRLLFYLAIDRC